MKLDPGKLRAEADAHAVRQQSELWAPPEGKRDESWMAPLTTGSAAKESAPQPQPTVRGLFPEVEGAAREPRFEELARNVERLTEAVNRRPMDSEDMPGWLLAAGGDPHSYDLPDSTRTGVCARVSPGTYARLKEAKRRLRLRTKAGAWEFLLRLGLAAAERLTAR